MKLSKMKLLSLEMRRLRREVFKIMHNLEGVKREDFFPLRTATGRRGHSLTILKQHCRLNVQKYFFTHRVVDTWNKLSEDTVNSKTVNSFKNQIDPWFKQHGGLYISHPWRTITLGVSLRARRDTTQVMLRVSLRARWDTTLVKINVTILLTPDL